MPIAALVFSSEQMERWLDALDLDLEKTTDLVPAASDETKLTVTLWLARDRRVITDLPVQDPSREVA